MEQVETANTSSPSTLTNNSSNHSSWLTPRCLSIITKAILILICLGIFIFIEKILLSLCKLIFFFTPLAIITLIILHLVFLRMVVLQIAFAGRNPFISKPMYYSIASSRALVGIRALEAFRTGLSGSFAQTSTETINYKDMKRKYIDMMSFVNYYIEIYSRISNRFQKLSEKQDTLYQALLLLKNEIIEHKVEQYITFKANVDVVGYDNNDNVAPIIEDISRNLSKIIISITTVLTLLNKLIIHKDKLALFQRIKQTFFNDMLYSLNHSRVELSDNLVYDEYKYQTKDNATLDYIIAHRSRSYMNVGNSYMYNNINMYNSMSSHHAQPNTKLLIICGPNGAPYESFSRSLQTELFFHNNCDVLFWNYRGFGYSTGKATFDNLRSDIVELFDYIDSLGIYTKYAVHGISIGGIPACYLAEQRSKISLLISDRNFGSIDYIAHSLPCGYILYYLYKCLIIPSSITVYNYMNAKCYKIVLNDPDDTIVFEGASMKTTVSKYYVNNIITNHKPQGSNNNNQLELIETRILSARTNENETIVINGTTNNKQLPLDNRSGLDLLLNYNESDKKQFIKMLIDISDALRNDDIFGTKQKGCAIRVKQWYNHTVRGVNYTNLKEEELHNTSGVDVFIRNKLSEFFENFESAGDCLYALCLMKSNFKKKVFINNFFSNLLVWGNKCMLRDNNGDDIQLFTTSDIEDAFTRYIEYLNTFLNAQEIQNYKSNTIIVNATMLHGYLTQMKGNIRHLKVKKLVEHPTHVSNGNSNSNSTELNFQTDVRDISPETNINNGGTNNNVINSNISNDIIKDYETSLYLVGKGKLVGLTCGHNGMMKQKELNSFYHQITLSGFLS